jgi:type IV pilus assembly protein PilM
MAKQDGVVGVYVAHGRLSLAMFKGKNVSTAWVDIPENVAQSSEIISKNLFAQFIKDTMKENGMKAKKAVFIIGSEKVLVREISMPKMNDEQLKVNLPYEFRDYIKGELKDYLYDYTVRNINTDDQGNDTTMDLLAVAIPLEYYNTLAEILTVAGLKLIKTVPELYVIENLIRLYDEEERNKERCFLDIGNNTIRMQIYKNGKYKLSHVIDIGEKYIIRAIADSMNVDMELAKTYLRTKYQECDKNEAVINAYKDVSLEVMKGFNFYEMSDMSSRLGDVVVYGSGAMIDPLIELLRERLNMNVATMAESFPEYDHDGDLNITGISVGSLLSLDDKKDLSGSGIDYDINFGKQKEKKKSNIGAVLCAIAAVILVILLAAKFLVLDRFSSLAKAQKNVEDLEAQIELGNQFINSGDELAEEFYHYTWTDMTDEEKDRVSRKEVAELVKIINNNKVSVRQIFVSENVLTVDITTDTLQSVSELSESLNGQKSVESVQVENAQKLEKDGYEQTDITLEGEEVKTVVPGTIVVEAQLKIYLTSKSMEEDN